MAQMQNDPNGVSNSPTVHTQQYPQFSVSLEDGLFELLAPLTGPQVNAINPQYIEDLMADVVTRLSNCLLLREKAADLERRGATDAINFGVQTATLQAAKEIADVLQPLKARMGQFALGLRQGEGQSLQFMGDDDTWQKIYAQQRDLTEAQVKGLEDLLKRATSPGGSLNLLERFNFLKRLFDLLIAETFTRARMCEKALNIIFDRNLPLPTLTHSGYLDALAIWCQQASDVLDYELNQRYTGDIAFALSAGDRAPSDEELLPGKDFAASLRGKRIAFVLDEAFFTRKGMRKPLLRSIRIHVKGKDETRVRLWGVRIEPPNFLLTPLPDNYSCIAPSTFEGSGNVDHSIRGVHNLPAIGHWYIALPDRSVTGELTSEEEIKNMYLQLRVSFRQYV